MRMKRSRGYEVQLQGMSLGDHGVPGVVSSIEASNDIGLLGQSVYDATFTFIPPLRSNDDNRRHKISPHSALIHERPRTAANAHITFLDRVN